MSKILEVIDSLNDENVEEIKEKLISEANALNKANGNLYKRAKKAEGFEYNKESREWTKKESKSDPKPKDTESSEPNYALEAFLEGRGVKHPDDKKLVKDEMERLKMPAGDVMGMEHIQKHLKDANDQREAESGTPKGRGGKGSSGKGSIDYHLAKGTTPDDPDEAEKVIEARMKQEEKNNKFSDVLYTG